MKTILHFTEFVKEIKQSNSKKYKQEVLEKYKDDEIIKKYLDIAFNSYTVYGISTKKLHKNTGLNILAVGSVLDLFDYLKEHNTGRDEDIAVCQDVLDKVAANDSEAAAILEELIIKDLSIGCDAKTINKVIPGLIPSFEIMLAEKFFSNPKKLEGKRFGLTTKIDGARVIAMKENGEVRFYSRSGKLYEELVDLENEFKLFWPEGMVLDGELTIFEDKGIPSKVAYKHAMKILGADGEKHGIKLKVFDLLSIEEFKNKKGTRTYEERRSILDSMFNNYAGKYFELLPLLYVGDDTGVIEPLHMEAVNNGEEGLMANLMDAVYEFKRTWAIQKIKAMDTLDLEIVGYEEGEGRLAGTLGAILVRYKNGNIVKVGSGFTDSLRKQIWADPESIISKIAEIQYFEETTNDDGGISLRFPVYKKFRDDKTVADF